MDRSSNLLHLSCFCSFSSSSPFLILFLYCTALGHYGIWTINLHSMLWQPPSIQEVLEPVAALHIKLSLFKTIWVGREERVWEFHLATKQEKKVTGTKGRRVKAEICWKKREPIWSRLIWWMAQGRSFYCAVTFFYLAFVPTSYNKVISLVFKWSQTDLHTACCNVGILTDWLNQW